MSIPTVIAISDCYEFTNTSHQLLFKPGNDHNTHHHLIRYQDDVASMQMIKKKCESCQHPLIYGVDLDFRPSWPLIPSHIKSQLQILIHPNRRRDMKLIQFHHYTIWYNISGAFAVYDDKEIYIKHKSCDDFQSGDCSSIMIKLDNGDVLIINEGEISSCLLFSIHHPKLYQVLDKKIEMENTIIKGPEKIPSIKVL